MQSQRVIRPFWVTLCNGGHSGRYGRAMSQSSDPNTIIAEVTATSAKIEESEI